MHHNHGISLYLFVLAFAASPFIAAKGDEKSVANQESPPHSAITPAPREEGAFQRYEMLNQRAKENSNAHVIFLGDSITHGWEGVPDLWEEHFGEYGAINLGIGGDRTQHVLWRLENGNIDGLHPEVAVVMIGTNNSNGEDNTVAEIADGVRAIVATLQARLPETRILLLEIFPRGQEPNAQRGKILQVNQILRKLDDGETVRVFDIGHHFVDEAGNIPPAIMPDFLHLSEEGYRIWADQIGPVLEEMIEE